jgi:hypothetical protein
MQLFVLSAQTLLNNKAQSSKLVELFMLKTATKLSLIVEQRGAKSNCFSEDFKLLNYNLAD